MKTRRHHNSTALTSTKRGKRVKEVKRIARKLKVPYAKWTATNVLRNIERMMERA